MGEETPTADAEVRRIARELAKDYNPHEVGLEIAEDERFKRGVELLATEGVDPSIVVRLAKSGSPIVAAIALSALTRKADDRTWTQWALRRLRRASSLETAFLLAALAEALESPSIARVLAEVDHDWDDEPVLQALAHYLARRVELGEEPTVKQFADTLRAQGEPVVSTILGNLADVPPSVQRAFDDWRRTLIDTSTIEEFAQIWPPLDPNEIVTLVGARERAVDILRRALVARRSVLLVGPHGVGKTTLIREALRRSNDDWIVFEAGAAAVMAGQMFIGQFEGRLQEIAKAMAGRSILWVFPDFEEALWSGQHSRSPRGVLDAMLPHVATQEIVVVGEIEESAYELLVQMRPKVASTFVVVRLSALSDGETVEVARDWVASTALDVSDATLRETLDLATHYLPSIGPPGNLLRLLKATRERVRRGDEVRIATRDVIETLSDATGLPLHILDPRTPLSVGEVRGYLSKRVLGQLEAVDCLVERITMIKAGLTDPTRPLGVFLFVGPTGTGKTELAKSLAEFLFGSADRMVRLDMSEFQTPESLERLLSDRTRDEEGAALISAVRKEPFSVVLLDEFEKAHQNIWDVFLQLFDDGRLTDRGGKTVDFRHCVLILTSNLGSAIEGGPGYGFARAATPFRSSAVERKVSSSFRPELLNRIDRIVVFQPLQRDDMRELLRHELSNVLNRRGFQIHPWAVEWDDAAIEFLLEKGFSPELGARPLKRAVERYLLAPLSMAIVERQFPEGDQFLFISAKNDRIDVAFVDPDEEEVAVPEPPPPQLRLESLVMQTHGTVEELRFLRAENERIAKDVDVWLGHKDRALEATRDPEFWESPDRFELLSRIEYLDRVAAVRRTATGLLSRLAARRNGRNPKQLMQLLAERLYLLDRACAGLSAGHAPDAFIAISHSGGEIEFAMRLENMYRAWAEKRGMRIRSLHASSDARVLSITGLGAFTILEPEGGLHVLETPEREQSFERVSVRVTVAPRDPGSDAAGESLENQAQRALSTVAAPLTVVRRYREEPSPLVRDSVRGWRTGKLERVLAGDFDVL